MDLVKILLLPVISVCVFLLPLSFALGLILVQTVYFIFKRLSVNDFFHYVKFFLFYLLLFYVFSILQNLFSLVFTVEISFLNALQISVKNTFFNKSIYSLFIKFFCIIQTAFIFYRITTTLQIRYSLEKLGLSQNALNLISLFFSFIPLALKDWKQIQKAWLSRGGKKSLRMLLVLLPVFFSVAMNQAYKTSKAILNRTKD